jgi:hypothetical protein
MSLGVLVGMGRVLPQHLISLRPACLAFRGGLPIKKGLFSWTNFTPGHAWSQPKTKNSLSTRTISTLSKTQRSYALKKKHTEIQDIIWLISFVFLGSNCTYKFSKSWFRHCVSTWGLVNFLHKINFKVPKIWKNQYLIYQFARSQSIIHCIIVCEKKYKSVHEIVVNKCNVQTQHILK